MTILCLHGAFSSAANFKVLLGPVLEGLEKAGPVDFKWINGGYPATPFPSCQNFFGPQPLYRFMSPDGDSAIDNMVNKIRELPEGATAEATMRELDNELGSLNGGAIKSAMERVFKIMDEDPKIDGLLGYSEGGSLAATLILEERRLFEKEGRPRRIKHATFVTGWPPVRLSDDGTVQWFLADECEDDFIDVPTCHIIGCKDPYLDGAMALFSVCDEDSATLFEHGKGHTVPRDTQTIEELVGVLHGTWAAAAAAS